MEGGTHKQTYVHKYYNSLGLPCHGLPEQALALLEAAERQYPEQAPLGKQNSQVRFSGFRASAVAAVEHA